MEKSKIDVNIPTLGCPRCGGYLVEIGVSNEYGFQCDTCSYPYQEENEGDEE